MPALAEADPEAAATPEGHVPVTLQWNDINLKIKLGKGDAMREKSILSGISAFAEPGELLAIMGPSGRIDLRPPSTPAPSAATLAR